MPQQGEASHLVEQQPPPQKGIPYEQIMGLLSMARSILQSKCDQFGHVVGPMWSTLWNKYRPNGTLLLPPSSGGHPTVLEEPKGSLGERYLEIKERLKKAHTQLNAKNEECQNVRRAWDEEVRDLKLKMEKLIQKDKETEHFLKEKSHELSEALLKRLDDIEHMREEHLAQMQSKLSEHHLAMSKLHEEAEASLAKVTQAISTFT